MSPNFVPTNAVPLSSNRVRPNGPRVRELRHEQGFTQETLARMAGVSKRTVENIESGKHVQRETLADVARALRVELEQLIAVEVADPAEEADRRPLTFQDGPHALPPPLRSAAEPVKCSVLVVDNEPEVVQLLCRQLADEFEVVTAESADAAQAVLGRRAVDIVLTDQEMPRRTGVQLLEWVRQHHPNTARLLMTAYADFNDLVQAINRGQVLHFVSKPWNADALLGVLRHVAEKFALQRQRDQLLEDLRHANRELEEANRRLLQRTRELERAALTDPLTGLFNRGAIEELARFEVRRRLRYRSPLSVGLIEVDQSDMFNTEPLRSGRDEVLEELAGILASSVREVDSVGRLHGERFLAVARETGPDGAAGLAERLRATIAGAPFQCNGQLLPITVSIGFAVAEVGIPADLKALTDLAAAALAEAKKAGGNRWEVRVLNQNPGG
jgi:diguanylate cyclase (GGDEF)-like protein